MGVWRRLTAGLGGLPVATPTAGALARDAPGGGRAVAVAVRFAARPGRCSARPWGVVAGPVLVCAVNGTTLTVPDSKANQGRFTKGGGNHGGTGYPQVRLLALVACGTRTVIDAVFGPTTKGETTYAPGLLRSLRGGHDRAAGPQLRRRGRLVAAIVAHPR